MQCSWWKQRRVCVCVLKGGRFLLKLTVVGLHQTSRLQGCCTHSTVHHETSAAIKAPLSVLDLLHLWGRAPALRQVALTADWSLLWFLLLYLLPPYPQERESKSGMLFYSSSFFSQFGWSFPFIDCVLRLLWDETGWIFLFHLHIQESLDTSAHN